MQNVMITGGAGFIGQNLVHAWRAGRSTDRLVVGRCDDLRRKYP